MRDRLKFSVRFLYHFLQDPRRKSLFLNSIRALAALLISVILCQFPFENLESLLYDARVRIRPVPETSSNLITIATDPATLAALGRAPNATDMKHVIENVRLAGAKEIVLLLNPSDFVGSLDDVRALAATLETPFDHPEIVPVTVAIDEVPLRGEMNNLKLLAPFDRVRVGSLPIPIDKNIFARDDVTRRMVLGYLDLPTLLPHLASLFNTNLRPQVAGDPFNRNAVQGVFEYLKSDQAYVNFRPRGSYKPLSMLRAIEALGVDKSSSEFRNLINDKVVLIGRDVETTSKDYIRTPYSRDVIAMTTLEYAANAIDTLILNNSPRRTPFFLNLVLTTIISFLTILIVLTLRPTQGLILLASLFFGTFFVGALSLGLFDIWLGLAQPMLAIFICYYFFIPYRLIVENRRSWEYLEKNRLLTQVEELKTNFLSMMSHDLKTPIARIQGMTEVVRQSSENLSSAQLEAIETIRRSSDQLLDFVSSILHVGRIESKNIQLQLQSRDLNTLIQESVQKLEYLARSKKIDFRLELEPLFSLKIDVDLIRQVLMNIIENAIKYSPEGAGILITSEDLGGIVLVQVADQGQGIPEDELAHIFMKFYRSRNAKSSTIKGSGLGLYLARYFVELHQGRISVDSTPGQGSTFSIELPY